MKGFVLFFLLALVLGKNVFNLDKLKASVQSEHDKRDAKNVFSPAKLEELLAQEQEATNEKRDGFDLLKQLKIGQPVTSNSRNKRDQMILEENNVLQSVLPQFKAVSIFSGYIRDNEQLSKKTEASSESLLLICPSDNSIATKLGGMKPWEFPKPLTGNKDDDQIADSNLNYFLSHHIVDNFADNLSILNVITASLLSGDIISFKSENDRLFVSVNDNDWILVDVSKKVDNGYILIIDDTLVKPE